MFFCFEPKKDVSCIHLGQKASNLSKSLALILLILQLTHHIYNATEDTLRRENIRAFKWECPDVSLYCLFPFGLFSQEQQYLISQWKKY